MGFLVAPAQRRSQSETSLDGFRHLYDTTIWSSDGVAWPNFGSGGHTCLGTSGTLINNSTTVGLTAGVGNVLFFDNPDNADFCWIEFVGSIVSITTGGAPVGESTTRAGLCALPLIGAGTIAAYPALAYHPLELKAYAITMADAWMCDAVGGQSQFVSSTPPFFGMWFGESFQTSPIPTGWPFNGNTITAGDRWSIQFPIGKLRDGSILSISGLRRIGLTFKSVNPALVAGNPSAMTIEGRMYAHFYEYRKRR